MRKRFRNLKVGIKLAVAVISMIILYIVTVATAVRNIRNMSEKIESLYYGPFANLESSLTVSYTHLEDKAATMAELDAALAANWEGFEELRAKAQAVPKYGNDDDYVDQIAIEIANWYYREIPQYKDDVYKRQGL